MKAILFEAPGSVPICTDVELAKPRSGEIEVTITAAGVCHSDLHVVSGDWDIPTPVVLGHELSGVVSALGPGVTDLSIGDHVVLSWVPSCGTCRYCLAGRPAQCALVAQVVAPLGVLHDGTSRLSKDGHTLHHYLGVSSFAERVMVPVSGAIRVRTDAPRDVLALVGCAVATGVGAVMKTANVQPGSTDAIDSSATDAVAALREMVPEGLDYVFDAIGKISTTEQAIAALGLGGAAVIVGLPPTRQHARFDPLALAEADQRILGSNYRSVVPQRDIPWLVDLYMSGELDLDSLVSARRPLSEAAEALADLAAGRALRQPLVPSIRGAERACSCAEESS